MWPLTAKRQRPDRDLESLKERLALMSARLDTLEKAYKEIDVEWSSWYDKFRNLYSRIAKRDSRAKQETEEPTPADEPINPLAQQILNQSPMLRRGGD